MLKYVIENDILKVTKDNVIISEVSFIKGNVPSECMIKEFVERLELQEFKKELNVVL